MHQHSLVQNLIATLLQISGSAPDIEALPLLGLAFHLFLSTAGVTNPPTKCNGVATYTFSIAHMMIITFVAVAVTLAIVN